MRLIDRNGNLWAKNDFVIDGVLKMRKTRVYVKCLLSLTLLTFIVGCVGCDIHFGDFGDFGREEFERTEQLSAPIGAGATLTAETEVGSITVGGGDVTECSVTATITAKAPTQEKANELAQAVKIKLEPEGGDLRLHVEKPAKKKRCSIGVSFDITIPPQVNLHLESDVGDIEVTNINGSIYATTDVGEITCAEVEGDVELEVDVGDITAEYRDGAESTFSARLETDVGRIRFTGPANLSASVDASTNVGSIETRLPLTVTGQVGKSVHGTVGGGEAKAIVHLKTEVGSIEIE
ncbi:MAG: DUF4097 family beta strand repeat-containing protein [Planctomycetota bacterium]